MIDREKVISKLQILRTWCAVNPDYDMGLSAEDCVKAVGWLDDALARLKAQDEKVVNLTTKIAELTTSQEQVVRCRDCKHRDPEDKKCDYGGMAVQGLFFPRPDDWYCADGERRDSE